MIGSPPRAAVIANPHRPIVELSRVGRFEVAINERSPHNFAKSYIMKIEAQLLMQFADSSVVNSAIRRISSLS